MIEHIVHMNSFFFVPATQQRFIFKESYKKTYCIVHYNKLIQE